jgi:SAM-dependent methyltransferase
MTPQIQAWVRQMKITYIFDPGAVLEIGSRNINGTVRQFFSDAKQYIGIDMESGEGVDIVTDSHNLIYEPDLRHKFFDTIICLETLEHDIDPFETMYQINCMLKHNGFLLISTPTFGFPLHRHPKDYWRFGEDAYREVLFYGYEILNLAHVLDTVGSPGICCIGRKL